MFTHIVVGSNDLEKSKKFYKAVFNALGYGEFKDLEERFAFFNDAVPFIVTKPINGEAATVGNGMTIGLPAPSAEAVDTCYKAGLENGGSVCELTEPPREKMSGLGLIYAAYLRDPDGNKLCISFKIEK